MNIYETSEGIEIVSFSTSKDMSININNIELIKVIGEWFSDEYKSYVFTLENDDKILVDMWEYRENKVFESLEGLIYKPVRIEHADNDRDIEYIGFQIVE